MKKKKKNKKRKTLNGMHGLCAEAHSFKLIIKYRLWVLTTQNITYAAGEQRKKYKRR